jgi:hypothetical protein
VSLRESIEVTCFCRDPPTRCFVRVPASAASLLLGFKMLQPKIAACATLLLVVRVHAFTANYGALGKTKHWKLYLNSMSTTLQVESS